jgi:hypothetical protein
VDPVWRTPEGSLLVRRRAQYLPYTEGPERERIEHSCDFDLLDPDTGAVLERWRKDCAIDREAGGYRWTHHHLEGDTLFEILVRVPGSPSDPPGPVYILKTTPLRPGLVPYEGPRWRTSEGHHLVEGPPLTTTHGYQPRCPLVEGAHDYALVDGDSGEVLREFLGSDVVIGRSDDEVLTRYVVEEGDLVEVVFDYHEDSCWGVGSIRGEKRRVVLGGLVRLAEE